MSFPYSKNLNGSASLMDDRLSSCLTLLSKAPSIWSWLIIIIIISYSTQWNPLWDPGYIITYFGLSICYSNTVYTKLLPFSPLSLYLSQEQVPLYLPLFLLPPTEDTISSPLPFPHWNCTHPKMCLNKNFQAAMLVEANLSILAGSSLVFHIQPKSPAFYWVSLNTQARETFSIL